MYTVVIANGRPAAPPRGEAAARTEQKGSESMEHTYNPKAQSILSEIKKAVVGKDDIAAKILMALLAQGHVLLDDIPGVGKTTLAMAFSKALSLDYHRMQFTPDVMPSDITGFTIYNKQLGDFEYKPGAAVCNLFLADEINRTSSKTQSALLEVMEEGRITVDGVTRETPKPFIVIATENPVGSAGTQILPESQLDRFLICLSMGYPDVESTITIMERRHDSNPLDEVIPQASREEILQMQRETQLVTVHKAIYEYVAQLTEATRNHAMITLGMSPRGALAHIRMAKAMAYLYGRDFVVPDDVQETFFDVGAHRLVLGSKARVGGVTAKTLLQEILNDTPAPQITESLLDQQ